MLDKRHELSTFGHQRVPPKRNRSALLYPPPKRKRQPAFHGRRFAKNGASVVASYLRKAAAVTLHVPARTLDEPVESVADARARPFRASSSARYRSDGRRRCSGRAKCKSKRSSTPGGRMSGPVRRASTSRGPTGRRPYPGNAGSTRNCPSSRPSPRVRFLPNPRSFPPAARHADAIRSPDRRPSGGKPPPARADGGRAVARTRFPNERTARHEWLHPAGPRRSRGE